MPRIRAASIYCIVVEMAPWVPVVVALVSTCFIAAAYALVLMLFAWLRRRIPTRHGKTADHPDWAFIVATKRIKHGDLVALRRSFASGLNSNLQDKHGNDLLMVAAHTGNVAVGELLITNGADVNRVSPSGYAAVWAALYGGHVRFLKLLFEHGADPDRTWGNRTIEEELQRYGFDAEKARVIKALLREYRARRDLSEA